ncbi:hypothetical protein [Rhodococcus sp. H-CA8f]|uniref:hypothetical protein n=1 Tax=Rhodococcus sp. H-CA8f TaxID=1727214 RepID=UPI0012FFC42C|nr:hypothetical protein [Rhodococcus sp. H-CA8f]
MHQKVLFEGEHLVIAEAAGDERAIGIELAHQGLIRAVTVGLWNQFIILRWKAKK